MPERTNFEIINRGQVTPQRMHALVRLVARRRQPSREEILSLLQPEALSNNTDAAAAVFAAAVRSELITHDTAADMVSLGPNLTRAKIESTDDFRWAMQERLCGVTDPDKDNYLLNEVVAWYAVQTPDTYRLKKAELATKFNQELYPQDEDAAADSGRAINDTKLNAWFAWTTFLGWGIVYGDRLWPVAHGRLWPTLAPLRKQMLGTSEFMDFLATACPELDGGSLFEQCWQASRPGQTRSQQLSFMLSTSLGTLHGLNRVELQRSTDSLDRWQIYPSTAYPFTDVTHIKIVE